jgi:hypothetical protein
MEKNLKFETKLMLGEPNVQFHIGPRGGELEVRMFPCIDLYLCICVTELFEAFPDTSFEINPPFRGFPQTS